MQTIRLNSKGEDVRALQKLLQVWGYDIPVTGNFLEMTDRAVKDFQERNGLDVDGIVGKCTWGKLMESESRILNSIIIGDEDFRKCAEMLEVDIAAVRAVKEVECGSDGFFEPERPAILFEGHVFWNQLVAKGLNPEDYLEGNEDILYPSWTKEHYVGGIGEYARLEKAKLIDEDAAMCSASWGLFQIMGFNYQACGCGCIHEFVSAMHESLGRHLELFAAFIKNNSLDQYLRDKDWAGFARRYNGAGYAENRYDEKLAAAYDKFKA